VLERVILGNSLSPQPFPPVSGDVQRSTRILLMHHVDVPRRKANRQAVDCRRQITNTMTNKAEEIRRILSEPVVDLWKLRELALTEGGLVNGALSQTAL